MSSIRKRRPSPASVIAFIALLAALSGTAIALPGKNSVERNDIKKNAVNGPKIKNNSVKGVDVDEASLGVVPNATQANSATNATNATTATNATNATNATTAANASNLGGAAPAAYLPSYAIVDTDGTVIDQKGVEAVNRFGAGLFAIRFTRPVAGKAFTATIAGQDIGQAQINTQPCIAPTGLTDSTCPAGFETANSQFVNTEDSAGTNADAAFTIVLLPAG